MIRYVLVAVLAVALLALSIPAVNYAATENTDRQVVSEIDSVETAADSLITNEEIPPEPASFDVTVVDTNSPVGEGGRIEVDVRVTNDGDVRDRQEVDLDVDGLGTDAVDLEAGEPLHRTEADVETANERLAANLSTIIEDDLEGAYRSELDTIVASSDDNAQAQTQAAVDEFLAEEIRLGKVTITVQTWE